MKDRDELKRDPTASAPSEDEGEEQTAGTQIYRPGASENVD